MLNKLKSLKTKGERRRVGRGMGSGKGGHTVGRGQKGQKSRAGYSRPRPGFEGGAMPLSRRIPKLKGFSRGSIKSNVKTIAINFKDIEKLGDGAKINPNTLYEHKIVQKKSKRLSIKLLAQGKAAKKLEVSGINVSQKARELVEKNGGKISDNI